jgi:hypothetical protein
LFGLGYLLLLQFLIAGAFLYAIFHFMTSDGSIRSRAISCAAFGAGIVGAAVEAAIRLGWLTTH